jgi:hypothetical protein
VVHRNNPGAISVVDTTLFSVANVISDPYGYTRGGIAISMTAAGCPLGPRRTPARTATATPTAVATPTRSLPHCVADCNGDSRVTIDELVRGVRIALGENLLGDCRSADANNDLRVSIDELVGAVRSALEGCASQ